MDTLKKNKGIIVLALVLGAFLFFSWKTEFSFVKLLQSNYVPGQQQPPKTPPQTAPAQPYVPGQTPGMVNEAEWRKKFEEERMK